MASGGGVGRVVDDKTSPIPPTPTSSPHSKASLAKGDGETSGEVVLEVCAESIESVIAAFEAGAGRVEICADLAGGGTTPSIGFIESAVKVARRVGGAVMVLIRPRVGDFCYSEDEIDVMERDVEAAVHAGVDGVVIGALTPSGCVDEDVVRRLCAKAKSVAVTFHRAIDVCSSIDDAVVILRQFPNITRILTSGGRPSVAEEEAIATISHLTSLLHTTQISVLAGGGVRPENVAKIMKNTGVREVHASCREWVRGKSTFRHEPVVFMGSNTDPEREGDVKRATKASVQAMLQAMDASP